MRKTEDIFADFMQNHEAEDGMGVKASDERALNYLCTLAQKDKAEVEDMLSYAGYEREKQGFINGFEYALSLGKGGALV